MLVNQSLNVFGVDFQDVVVRVLAFSLDLELAYSLVPVHSSEDLLKL